MARAKKHKIERIVPPFPCPECQVARLIAVDEEGDEIVDLDRQGAAQWFCSSESCAFGVDAAERCPADGAPVRFDANYIGTTVGGLRLRGANMCDHCGGAWVTRQAKPVDDRWRLASSGRSVDAGAIRIRGEAAGDESGDMLRDVMRRIARVPELEAVLRDLSNVAAVRHALPDFDQQFDRVVAAARKAIDEQPHTAGDPEVD